MLNSKELMPNVVEVYPRTPTFVQLLRTQRHLVLDRCCSALGSLGDRLMARADTCNIRTDSAGILSSANALVLQLCLINRL